MTDTGTPTLVVVSGPPRTGKTTLAHMIARAVPCPAVCRDEIKEGMVHAAGDGSGLHPGIRSRNARFQSSSTSSRRWSGQA